MTFREFAEELEPEFEIQPYQQDLIDKLEALEKKEFNREEKAEELALLPHEYGTRLDHEINILKNRDKEKQKRIFINYYYEHWKTDGAHAGCKETECPICEAIRERAGVNDFIKEEEMKL